MDQHLTGYGEWGPSVSDEATQGGQAYRCWPLVKWCTMSASVDSEGSIATTAAAGGGLCAHAHAGEFPASFE